MKATHIARPKWTAADRARHMEVRLQGSVAWKDLWEALKGLANDLNLQQLMLDVNAPLLHEGYHARWDHAQGAPNERPRWYVEIPMTSQGLSVGRLVMSGWPDQQPVWDKIALVMKIVEDFNNPVTAVAAGLRLDSEAYGIAIAGPMSRMRENLSEHISALKKASASIGELSRGRAVANAIG